MNNQGLTYYLLFVIATILLSAFQYGYHNGALNTPQSVISKCQQTATVYQPDCIPMSDSKYSLVVAMLTAGGLVGALGCPHFSDRYGRRLTLFSTNLFLGIGSLLLTFATTPYVMMIGRFLAGVGAGMVTVIVPPYISECVPPSKRGLFGTFNQLSIVIGIMIAQIVGLMWSTLARWRYILAIGILLAILQSCLLPFCVDSPRYLASLPGGFNRAKQSLLRLRGTSIEEVEDEIIAWRREWANQVQDETLVDEHHHGGVIQSVDSGHEKVTSWKFLTSPFYRRPLLIILLLQLAQQLSGVNAVVFYSTSIMSSVFPELSGVITVCISIVNLIMTTVSAMLMDKVGRRSLFLTSSSLMALMAFLLGWSITNGYDKTSAFAIIGFIASFAIGLGPIPFLMIPEVVETHAVSVACSVGLAVNMISNFIVSAGFLSLQNTLGAQAFYVFSVALIALTTVAVFILPETKGRSAEDVIRSGYSIYSCSYEPINSFE